MVGLIPTLFFDYPEQVSNLYFNGNATGLSLFLSLSLHLVQLIRALTPFFFPISPLISSCNHSHFLAF